MNILPKAFILKLPQSPRYKLAASRQEVSADHGWRGGSESSPTATQGTWGYRWFSSSQVRGSPRAEVFIVSVPGAAAPEVYWLLAFAWQHCNQLSSIHCL